MADCAGSAASIRSTVPWDAFDETGKARLDSQRTEADAVAVTVAPTLSTSSAAAAKDLDKTYAVFIN